MRYKSNLFIPGHTLDRLDRGLNSNASALIIDLEDGCPDDKKIEAREELIGLLKKGDVFTKPLFVRVNDAMNENGRQDIDALSDFENQIEAIILPKTQSFDFLATLAPMIAFENKLVPLIETPRAVDTVTQIAAFKGVIGLFFGAADFSAGMGSKLAWEPLLYARHKVALAAAMYNLFTIDAPFFYIDNEEGLKEEAEKVKNLGFTGKAAIHPSQIDFINDAFEPTKEEKEEAKKVLEEYQKMDGGAVKIDGKMVDEPIAEAMRLKLSLGDKEGEDRYVKVQQRSRKQQVQGILWALF